MSETTNYAKRYRTNKYRLLKIVGIVLLAAIIIFIVFKTLLGFSVVSGNSMYPTYHDGQPVFYSRLDKSFDVGDVIAMNYLDGEFYIKRIVATAGDTVEIRDGVLYVNNEPSPYDFGETAIATSGNVTYPLIVPEDSVFVAGDNRGINEETGGLFSIDSRTFGPVSVKQLLGVLF